MWQLAKEYLEQADELVSAVEDGGCVRPDCAVRARMVAGTAGSTGPARTGRSRWPRSRRARSEPRRPDHPRPAPEP